MNKLFFLVFQAYNPLKHHLICCISEQFNAIALAVVLRLEVNYTEPVCD